MSNARVRKKTRGGDPPDPQIPRVEVKLVAQLVAVLSLPCPVSTLGDPQKQKTEQRGNLPGGLVAGALSCRTLDSRGYVSFLGWDTCRPPFKGVRCMMA